MSEAVAHWPTVEYSSWAETCETLHMWVQIVGKLKLELCPPVSHWWHVALHVTTRGLATGPIPYQDISFEIEFDLIAHELRIATSSAKEAIIKLEPKSVKQFYLEFKSALDGLGIAVKIDTMPKEVMHPIVFDQDTQHASYDKQAIEDFRTVLVNCDRAFREFHAKFCGKSSPVQFFWGSFDLSAVRFSGRIVASTNSDGSQSEIEEEYAVGFWPGSESYPKAAFYAYASPPPEGYYALPIQPNDARFDEKLNEFILDYEFVRASNDPHRTILAFAQSTYEALANLSGWDRAHLERVILEPIPG